MSSLLEEEKIKSSIEAVPHNKFAQKDIHYEIRFLDRNCLEDILNLQNIICSDLPDPEIFRPHDKDYFWDLFRREGAVLGVLAKKELIAYSLIRFPGQSPDNLGRDIGLADYKLNEVAHLQATAVHPLFRGNGLQLKMAKAHLRVIKDKGFSHVCCTVSPKNPASLKNILSCGLLIKALKPKFGEWWRYVMHKNNLDTKRLIGSEEADEIEINIIDIKGQIDLLKNGFVGFKMAHLQDGFYVFYKKPNDTHPIQGIQ